MEQQEADAIKSLADDIITHCDSSDGKAVNQCEACRTCQQHSCEAVRNAIKIKRFCQVEQDNG